MKTHHILFPIFMMGLLAGNICLHFRIQKVKAEAKMDLYRSQESLSNAQQILNRTHIIQPEDSLEFKAYVMAKVFRRCGGSNATVIIFGDCGHQQAIMTMTNDQAYFYYGQVNITRQLSGPKTEL